MFVFVQYGSVIQTQNKTANNRNRLKSELVERVRLCISTVIVFSTQRKKQSNETQVANRMCVYSSVHFPEQSDVEANIDRLSLFEKNKRVSTSKVN